jgi:hypothetical protein
MWGDGGLDGILPIDVWNHSTGSRMRFLNARGSRDVGVEA